MLLILLMLSLAIAVGCGTQPPPAAQLLEANTQLLTEMTVKEGKGILAQGAAGDLVITVWKKGADKSSIRGGSAESSRPVVGWADGFQAVAGRFSGEQAARVEVTTESGIVAGKLENGAYLVLWPVPALTGRFVLRIYDAKGNELYRWAPTSGPAAA